ncbi:hypothetical protein [Mycobacterium sp. URHB0021]
MGRTNLRLAAGAGVVATCLLVAGPVEGVAAAHPGDSHSDRPNNGHRSDSRGRGDSRDESKRGNDNNDHRGDRRGERGRGGDNDGRKGGGGSYGRTGGGNSNRNDDNGHGDRYTDSGDGNGDKSGATGDAGQRSVSASSRSAQVPTASLAPDTSDSDTIGGTVDVPTVPTFPVDQGGSDFSGTPPADPFTPPQVTFGNGRTPAPPESDAQLPRVTYRVPDVAPAPPLSLPSPAPAAPAAATAPPSWVVRISAPTAAPQLVAVAPVGWVDPLFGLTGLLLIPIAGAALGYRQARAAQHAKSFRQALPQA